MDFRDLKAQYEHIKPQIDAAIQDVVTSAAFVYGAPVAQLEEKLARHTGRRHCLTCGNGTDALELMFMAWEIGQGDAVFVPDFTFFASAEAVSSVGGIPIFVDVEQDSFNICPKALEQAVQTVIKEGKAKPKAILAVDLFGRPANYEALAAIAEQYNLLLFEDAAQGFGGSYKNKCAGSFGVASTTSFFPAKPLGGYGDGGAIFTDDSEKDALLRSLAVHGKGEDKYANIRIGRNSRLDTIQAAILQVKLNVLVKEELDQVNKVAEVYTERLSGIVKTPLSGGDYYSSWAQYTIQLKDSAQRDALAAALRQAGIPTMVYYPIPLHQQKAFASIAKYQVDGCPISCGFSNTVLSLPMHPYLPETDIERICQVISLCL